MNAPRWELFIRIFKSVVALLVSRQIIFLCVGTRRPIQLYTISFDFYNILSAKIWTQYKIYCKYGKHIYFFLEENLAPYLKTRSRKLMPVLLKGGNNILSMCVKYIATLRLSSGIDNGHCFRSSGNSAWMICCKLQHVDGLCRCYIRHPPMQRAM